MMAGFSRSHGLPTIVVAVALLTLAGCTTSTSTPQPARTTTERAESATVSRVSDGDTLRTITGGRIRLVQIDAPELRSDCFGKGALTALR